MSNEKIRIEDSIEMMSKHKAVERAKSRIRNEKEEELNKQISKYEKKRKAIKAKIRRRGIQVQRTILFAGTSLASMVFLGAMYFSRGEFRAYPSGLLNNTFWFFVVPTVLVLFFSLIATGLYYKDLKGTLRK